MQLIDWLMIAVPLLVILSVAIYTQRYIKSVADFLSGGRLAGRYLLAVARGEMGAGVAVFVAVFEVTRQAGFAMTWWSWISVPVGLIVLISGFVIYRYRETRAMTLAQFFEIRYSRAFRLFAGMLAFLAGIVNFGIMPAIGARFFVYFLGLPHNLTIFSLSVPTYIPLMALFLGIALTLALCGGVLTVMVIDCLDGIMAMILYLAIIASLLWMFSWSQTSEVLSARPPGQSLLNPFDSMGLKDFNMFYVLMSMFVSIYGMMAWQNQSGFNSAALNAHEARMAAVLGRWREMGKGAVTILLGICAMTYLAHPDFASQAALVKNAIAQIADPKLQRQMEIPITLSYLLIPGIKGALCITLLMGIFGGDSNHLHSWGSLFIQDVVMPLRKKPLTPQQHIRLLRFSIFGVALFAFLFGILYRQTEYVMMWWQVTMALFVGGAGAAIIGGLYWKKGTTAGAWAAMVTGSFLCSSGMVLRAIYDLHGSNFPLNPMQISFFSSLIAITLYIVVSLLTNRGDFNMDRMLHRGEYAVINELVGEAVTPIPRRKVWLGKILGFDENFTLGDKWLAGLLAGYGMFWFVVFIVGTCWNLISPWPTSVWSTFWHIVGVGLPIFFAAVTSVWFTWGGLRDIRDIFRRLRLQTINPLDDGRVVGHQNLDESVLAVEKEQEPLDGKSVKEERAKEATVS